MKHTSIFEPEELIILQRIVRTAAGNGSTPRQLTATAAAALNLFALGHRDENLLVELLRRREVA